MSAYTSVTLKDRSPLKERAAAWSHNKWSVPKAAYIECMNAYLNNETGYGRCLCLDVDKIIGSEIPLLKKWKNTSTSI